MKPSNEELMKITSHRDNGLGGDVEASATTGGYLEAGTVRIYPPHILFSDPFEGKHFAEKIVIQNVGRSPVFLRILRPTASGVFMKTLRRGRFLPSGLRICRHVHYTVVMATLFESCCIPIYVDNCSIGYEIFVEVAPTRLYLEPLFLDFGFIDAGPMPSKRKLKIINKGVKPTRFTADLGINAMNIVVEPAKGMIMPNRSCDLNVSLSSSVVGSYETEFWIISDLPMCVKVFVKVVMGSIEVVHERTMSSFTCLNFPRTYYGGRSMQTLLLKNNSQNASIFCATGEINGKVIHLDDLDENAEEYRIFRVEPLNGRLHRRDVRPFIFTFEPIYDTRKRHVTDKGYILAVIVIHKVHCRDVDASIYEDGLFKTDKHKIIGGMKRIFGNIPASLVDMSTVAMGADMYADYEYSEEQEEQETETTHEVFFSSKVRLILFGEMEMAKVTTVPDQLALDDLLVKKTVERVLKLTNCSQHLPVTYAYKKRAFVEILPKTGRLTPCESVEVLVRITAQSYVHTRSFIEFDLLDVDQPNLDGSMRIVGGIKVPIILKEKVVGRLAKPEGFSARGFRFEKPNFKPRKKVLRALLDDDVFLALPDDLPLTLKTWNNTKVFKTMYAAIPRKLTVLDYNYQFSDSLKEFKKHNKATYNTYIQGAMKMIQRKLQKKRTASIKHRALQHRCVEVATVVAKEEYRADFTPLSPTQLFNIKVRPRNVIFDKLVTNSRVSNTLTVYNGNKVSIRVFAKPHKPNLFQVEDQRIVVEPGQEGSITYAYITSLVGTRSDMVDLIVNENHVFETSITTKVHPTKLQLDKEVVTFTGEEPMWVSVTLKNPCKTMIFAVWDDCTEFLIQPQDVLVDEDRSLSFVITCIQELCTCPSYELKLVVNNRIFYTLKVNVTNILYEIELTKSINFGLFSVNIAKTMTTKLSNRSNAKLPFVIDDDGLLDGITISPKFGILQRKGFQIISVTAKRSKVGSFSCKITVTMANSQVYSLEISGEAALPKLSLYPKLIRFRRMTASSYDVKRFTVSNIGNVMAAISFEIDQEPQFHYKMETDCEFFTSDDIVLIEPNKQEQFLISYHPQMPDVLTSHLPILVNELTDTEHIIKTHVCSLAHRLLISDWTYEFLYYAQHDGNPITNIIKIENPGRNLLTFCVRFDDLRPPYTFYHVDGGFVKHHEYSMVCTLDGSEVVKFGVTFNPRAPGTYNIRLPLYIKDDLNANVHNYLQFKGKYLPPEASFDCESVFFGFLPLTFLVEKVVVVTFINHKINCEECVNIEDDTIFVTTKKDYENDVLVLELTLAYSSPTEHIVDTELVITCSCGMYETLRCFGGSDNCFLTVHATVAYFDKHSEQEFWNTEEINRMSSGVSSLMAISVDNIKPNKIESTFPRFPPPDDKFGIYMNNVVSVVEQWIHEQVFQGNVYYVIPDSISQFEVEVVDSCPTSGGEILCRLPLQKLLVELIGERANDLFKITMKEGDKICEFVFNLYTDIIRVMKNLGALIPHVFGEYLLDYRTFTELMTVTKKQDQVMPYEDFYSRSKQCWIDLLLQVYTVLVFKRVALVTQGIALGKLRRKVRTSRSSAARTSSNASVRSLEFNRNIYSCEDLKLMTWLNRSLERQKLNLSFVDLSNVEFLTKMVYNFCEDLSDGLAFLAATLTYVPYLADHLKTFYVPPYKDDERLHNACLLLEVWSMLKMSFTLTPFEMVNPNSVQMAMFVLYLHDFLKNMRPTERIEFCAKLGDHTGEKIFVENCNTEPITFDVIFYNNCDNTFSAHVDTLVIPPQRTGSLTVTYSPRFLRKDRAVLVLNGEVLNSKYTNSKAFELEGVPLLTAPKHTFTCAAPIYHAKPMRFNVTSPYCEMATYELYLSTKPLLDIEYMNPTPYVQILKNKILAGAKFDNYIFVSDENGNFALNGEMHTVTSDSVLYWGYFKSSVGDFFVELVLMPKLNFPATEIELLLPNSFMDNGCVCVGKTPDLENTKCHCNVLLTIPTKNETRWKVVVDKYVSYCDEQEKAFWRDHENTTMGVVLLERILRDRKALMTPDVAHVFEEEMFFDVKVKQKLIKVERIIYMDMRQESVNLKVHLGGFLTGFTLQLESRDRNELRKYDVSIRRN